MENEASPERALVCEEIEFERDIERGGPELFAGDADRIGPSAVVGGEDRTNPPCAAESYEALEPKSGLSPPVGVYAELSGLGGGSPATVALEAGGL